ncbi:TetR/AcrR family transcriptional regulator [Bacillus sp. NP157]|nr:TetR/AcrR family transcriptional regulator [Bacillus sp. NP157]
MRYAKDHKEKTRQRIIETAAQNFREKGFEGEGIASVMQGAGLTNGAFFNHFSSKEDLAREVIAFAMAERLDFVNAKLDNGEGVQGYIASYLSIRHRDHPEHGCPMATLATDIARRAPPVREAFSAGLNTLVDRLATEWPQLGDVEARARGFALFSLLNGCLQLARATDDEALSAEILASGRRAAKQLVEAPADSA